MLGVVQGVTEFLPVSSTAHLLIASRLLGFQDPGGVFTVMIQLGSIFAVVWLYRAKILDVVTGLPSRPEARRFAAMVLVALVPALVAGGLLSGFVTRVLYNALAVSGVTFVLGGIAILVIERVRPVPTVHDVDQTPIGKAFAHRRLPGAGDCPGRLALRRHDHGRARRGPRSRRGGGVLVLPGDPDAHAPRSRTACGRSVTTSRARRRRRSRSGS